MPVHLSGFSPTRAFPLGLGLIEAYLKGRCGQGVSPHCQGREFGGFWQTEAGSKLADAQALALRESSRERKRPTVPLGGLCPHTGCAAGGAKELPDRLWITRALSRGNGQE